MKIVTKTAYQIVNGIKNVSFLKNDELDARALYLKISIALKYAGFVELSKKFEKMSNDEGGHYKILNNLQNVQKKNKNGTMILFVDNDVGEVYVFTKVTEALKFMETGWIEETLQHDEQNVVLAVTMKPIDFKLVEIMKKSESLGSENKTFVFTKNEQDEYEQVTNDDIITKKKIYFVVDKELARIDATNKDPNTGKFKHRIDKAAIKKLKIKIQKM